MNKIGFNIMQLFEEKTSSGERFFIPSADSFSQMETSFYVLMDNIYYDVNVEKEDNYIWFAFDYGNPGPIDDKYN